MSIFIGENEASLTSKKGLPLGEEPNVNVVKYAVCCSVVPVVNVELPAEVHMSAKTSSPFGFAESAWTDDTQTLGSTYLIRIRECAAGWKQVRIRVYRSGSGSCSDIGLYISRDPISEV